jgi:hypothetical protein
MPWMSSLISLIVLPGMQFIFAVCSEIKNFASHHNLSSAQNQ